MHRVHTTPQYLKLLLCLCTQCIPNRSTEHWTHPHLPSIPLWFSAGASSPLPCLPSAFCLLMEVRGTQAIWKDICTLALSLSLSLSNLRELSRSVEFIPMPQPTAVCLCASNTRWNKEFICKLGLIGDRFLGLRKIPLNRTRRVKPQNKVGSHCLPNFIEKENKNHR